MHRFFKSIPSLPSVLSSFLPVFLFALVVHVSQTGRLLFYFISQKSIIKTLKIENVMLNLPRLTVSKDLFWLVLVIGRVQTTEKKFIQRLNRHI